MSLADAELGEDDIQQIFDIHRPGNAAEPIRREAKVVGPQFEIVVVSLQGGVQARGGLT
jgi:hypothetical protein